jgi:hypothetical protein
MAAAVAVLVCAGPAPARAEPGHRSAHLTRAVDAIGERDYEKARVHLRLALEAGDHLRDDTVLIYRLSGEVAAAFGKPDEARRFFERMLAMDPRAEVSEASAPNVVGPYDEARATLADQQPIAVSLHRDAETRIVTVEIEHDPLDMITAIRLVYRSKDKLVSREMDRINGEIPIDVPELAGSQAAITVIDRYGNHLTELMPAMPDDGPAAPIEPSPEAVTRQSMDRLLVDRPDPGTSGSSSVFARWYLWGGVAAGAGAVAVVFGRQATAEWARLDQLIDDSATHDYAEAQEIERRGRRNALISNIAAGAAATSAAVGLVLLVRSIGDDGDSGDKKKRIVGATPLRGGAAVTLEVGF